MYAGIRLGKKKLFFSILLSSSFSVTLYYNYVLNVNVISLCLKEAIENDRDLSKQFQFGVQHDAGEFMLEYLRRLQGCGLNSTITLLRKITCVKCKQVILSLTFFAYMYNEMSNVLQIKDKHKLSMQLYNLCYIFDTQVNSHLKSIQDMLH